MTKRTISSINAEINKTVAAKKHLETLVVKFTNESDDSRMEVVAKAVGVLIEHEDKLLYELRDLASSLSYNIKL